jgi:hypothetical protein
MFFNRWNFSTVSWENIYLKINCYLNYFLRSASKDTFYDSCSVNASIWCTSGISSSVWHKCAGLSLVTSHHSIAGCYLTFLLLELLQRICICCCLKFLTFVRLCQVFFRLKHDVQVARLRLERLIFKSLLSKFVKKLKRRCQLAGFV